MKRAGLLFALAAALVGGAIAGQATGDASPGRAITIRTIDGGFVGYLARDGRALLRTAEGYAYLEVEPSLAGAIVNSVATLDATQMTEIEQGYTLALDAGTPVAAFADPRISRPPSEALVLIVDELWRAIDAVPTVPAAAPSLRVRLTPLEGTPSPFFTLRDVFTLSAATAPAGERISGDRLARLITVRPALATGVDASPFAVLVDGTYYRVDWSPEPLPDELAPATSTP